MSISKEELAFRTGKLGASNAATALGISPWDTKASLYNEILGYVKRDDLGEKGILGNELEPVISRAYERATGIKIQKAIAPIHPGRDPKAPAGTFIHPKYPWMIAHLDGEMPDYEMILEIKNVGWTVAHQWGLDGDPEGPPVYVQAQCVQQAILAGVERVDVAAFFGGNELRVYPMEIGERRKQLVLDGLVAFWEDHIVKKVQPEMTGKDLDLLKKLYPGREEQKIITVESTATALMFQDYRNLKAAIKESQEKSDAYKAKIIQFKIGRASCRERV